MPSQLSRQASRCQRRSGDGMGSVVDPLKGWAVQSCFEKGSVALLCHKVGCGTQATRSHQWAHSPCHTWQCKSFTILYLRSKYNVCSWEQARVASATLVAPSSPTTLSDHMHTHATANEQSRHVNHGHSHTHSYTHSSQHSLLKSKLCNWLQTFIASATLAAPSAPMRFPDHSHHNKQQHICCVNRVDSFTVTTLQPTCQV